MIGRRFEERFGAVLKSRATHVHSALHALENAGLIERKAVAPAGTRRQPKTPFRGTQAGAAEHNAWLASPLSPVSMDREFDVRALCIRDEDVETHSVLLEQYELAVLTRTESLSPEDDDDPMGAIFRQRERLRADAALHFVELARLDLGVAVQSGR